MKTKEEHGEGMSKTIFTRKDICPDVYTDISFRAAFWQNGSDIHLARKKLVSSMCPEIAPVDFELTTSRSSVPSSANCTREESVGDVWNEVSFVSCTTSHVGLCLFLDSIEHEFIKALMIHTHNQIVAQLAKHGTDDLEVVSSNPLGTIFDEIYFVLCNLKSVR